MDKQAVLACSLRFRSLFSLFSVTMENRFAKIENNLDALKEELRTDPNVERVKNYARIVPQRFPSAAKQYFLDKLPIVQWLPRYSPSWIVSDFSK
jgi:hypothetical protein